MLHVKGTRVLHELFRSYFWPKMAEEIKQFCTACEVCQNAQIQRQNLSSVFRQATEKDMPLPRQAYGIDFYGIDGRDLLPCFAQLQVHGSGLSVWPCDPVSQFLA
jgi:hypothetical protein